MAQLEPYGIIVGIPIRDKFKQLKNFEG